MILFVIVKGEVRIMDTTNEKKYIYKQFKIIIEERRRLSKIYDELKNKLDELKDSKEDTVTP